MNIGILVSDFTIGKIYKEELSVFGDVYLFHDPDGFIAVADHFDFFILDHQINCKPWMTVFTRIPAGKPTLVLTTYPMEYYKNEFNDSFYKDLEPILTITNVFHSEKDQIDKIKRILRPEYLRIDCQNILNRVSYKNPR